MSDRNVVFIQWMILLCRNMRHGDLEAWVGAAVSCAWQAKSLKPDEGLQVLGSQVGGDECWEAIFKKKCSKDIPTIFHRIRIELLPVGSMVLVYILTCGVY